MRPYGYLIDCGYKGLTKNGWMLFTTEQEYIEYLEDD